MELHDRSTKPAAGVRPTPARDETSAVHLAHAVEDPATAGTPEVLELQRLAGNATVSRMLSDEPTPDSEAEQGGRSPVLDVVERGGGQPLDPTLRHEMEGRLGADFSDVRLHTGLDASESARSVDALAYTVGRDVVVRADRWAPSTPEGKQTLAHELTHVVQQSQGPVDGTSTGDGIRLSDPSDRFERAAARNAERVMAGSVGSAGPARPAAAPTAQRQEEEEEELQMLTAQRQEEEEEEEEAQALTAQREDEEEEEEEKKAKP